jgi:hypothetical protein
MVQHKHFPRRLVRIVLTVGIAASVLIVASILTAPPAAAGGYAGSWAHHWVAGGYQDYSGLGVQAHLKTHVPSGVPTSDAQSLARIAVVSADGNHAIETGWMVAPWAYGDSQPHFYVAERWYDAASNTFKYCYDAYAALQAFCGWVQVSATHAPGMALAPETTHIFAIGVTAGNWWVSLDSEGIGYIPSTDYHVGFTSMARAEWYGEVDAQMTPSCADMGNGLYGTQAGAAQLTWLFVQHWDVAWTYATPSSYATLPWLYNVSLSGPSRAGYSFAYGGPGAC